MGQGPIRTGVTAIWPTRKILEEYLPCGYDVPNGNGEVTGLVQLQSLGILGSPICLTNTSSVGMVYDAVLDHLPADDLPPTEPVVGETWDAVLNDIEGRHVHKQHVDAALKDARPGPVAEGCVGGGTGMICYQFKGGIGTASRKLPPPLERYTVGVLVQANHGARELLRIDGVPVGEEIVDLLPVAGLKTDPNSILMVVATDAPLLDYQLNRLARRAGHGSGQDWKHLRQFQWRLHPGFQHWQSDSASRFLDGATPTPSGLSMRPTIYPLLEAASEATEEAIVNALFLATDMEGRDGSRVFALPLDRTLEIMQRHHRLFPPEGEGGQS